MEHNFKDETTIHRWYTLDAKVPDAWEIAVAAADDRRRLEYLRQPTHVNDISYVDRMGFHEPVILAQEHGVSFTTEAQQYYNRLRESFDAGAAPEISIGHNDSGQNVINIPDSEWAPGIWVGSEGGTVEIRNHNGLLMQHSGIQAVDYSHKCIMLTTNLIYRTYIGCTIQQVRTIAMPGIADGELRGYSPTTAILDEHVPFQRVGWTVDPPRMLGIPATNYSDWMTNTSTSDIIIRQDRLTHFETVPTTIVGRIEREEMLQEIKANGLHAFMDKRGIW